MAKSKKRIYQMTNRQWEAAFPTEDACRTYLTGCRWPKGVRCPRCGAEVGVHGTMAFNWQCYACADTGTSYRFSVLVGTVFENTKYPLREWFRVIHLMLTSKKGISALQIHRMIGTGSYRTAWSMCHRIRAGLANEDFRKLMGIVEVDETFIGGKAKNRHWDKRGGGGATGGSGKDIVAGAVKRGGKVVARVIADVRARTLETFVHEAVSTKVSLLCTDKWVGYKHLDRDYPHETVDHARGEYVVGAVHTQTIEGFWSLIKRGMVGTYHKVSAKYLPLYVAEFQFRYNNRLNADIFGEARARYGTIISWKTSLGILTRLCSLILACAVPEHSSNASAMELIERSLPAAEQPDAHIKLSVKIGRALLAITTRAPSYCFRSSGL